MTQTLLEMRGIRKTFGGNVALDDVSFALDSGEVHCLVGENGAGKSTLIKILTGAYKKDRGEILLQSKPLQLESPIDAQHQGVSAVYQEPQLIPALSVAENIFLGRLPSRNGILQRGLLHRRASEILGSLGLELRPETPAGTLSLAERQMVLICKSLSLNARILILDEPTAMLTAREVEKLFEVVQRLKRRGVSTIYISHRLDEVFRIGDRVTVLKDGQVVATVKTADVQRDDLIQMMVGRRLGALFPTRKGQASREVVLELLGLSRQGKFSEVSVRLHKGEILGLAGLVGSGRTEVLRCIYGADRPDAGEVQLGSHPVSIRSPRDGVRRGMGFVPEDRRSQGLVLNLSLRENLSIVDLKRFSRLGFVNQSFERKRSQELKTSLQIKAASLETAVQFLSGGTQQKVVLAKWLDLRPLVFLLDEPTKGVDVQTKQEIYGLIVGLADQGAAVLLVSSELPELLGLCDRVIYLREGRCVGEQVRHEFDEHQATRYIVEGRL